MSRAVEQIKAKLSIVDVVSAYIKLEKAGVNYKARCPFHNERTPSFSVSPSRESFHCFGCGKGGDIFTFVEEIEGASFTEALKTLAEKAGVRLEDYKHDDQEKNTKEPLRRALEEAIGFYEKSLSQSKEARDYLLSRGLSLETIRDFRLGFAPAGWGNLKAYFLQRSISLATGKEAGLFIEGIKGLYDRFRARIMFPIFDQMGNPIGFTGRILPGNERDTEGKYINTPQTLLYDKSKAVYALKEAKQAIREKDQCILVEGQMDALLSHQVGLRNCVAISGTALTAEHLRNLRRFSEKLVFVLDSDEAGFNASSRSVLMALSLGLDVRAVTLPEKMDPADFIKAHRDEWAVLIEKNIPFIDFALTHFSRTKTDSRELHDRLRTHLYPYIEALAFPIERDEAFKKIAHALDVSPGSVREDFGRSQALAPSHTKTDLPEGARSSEEKAKTRSALLSERIGAIILWQSRLSTPTITVKDVMNRFGKLLNGLPSYLTQNAEEKNNSDRATLESESGLVFIAESYYSRSTNLAAELELLFNQLEEELFKERLSGALLRLRKAEREKDSKEEATIMREIQDLTKAIHELKLRGSQKL